MPPVEKACVIGNHGAVRAQGSTAVLGLSFWRISIVAEDAPSKAVSLVRSDQRAWMLQLTASRARSGLF